MSRVLLLLLMALAAALARAEGVDLKARSVSSSRQFVVYCEDVALRGRVVGFAEQVKTEVLALLGEGDRWKAPVIITLQPAEAGVDQAVPVQLRPVETPGGTSIEIDVRVGDRPAEIYLRKHIVRAVLLEVAYRDRGGVKGGESYVEAPWWLVEGALELFRQREIGVQPELFQRLVEANRLPPIADFLRLRGGSPGPTAQAIDAACSACLVQILVDQPNGRANLGRLVRRWSQHHEDPVAGLVKEFPALGQGEDALQKWWTLSVARFSATDRYRGLSAEATDKELAALLEFELVTNKAGDKKKFTVSEFPDFVKLPSSKAAMAGVQLGLVALSTRANGLLRSTIVEYERIFEMLKRGKVKGVAERIETAEQQRRAVMHRKTQIADYLNWYEATQLKTESHAFDGYFQAADEIAAEEERIKQNDPIKLYLDQLEKEL